MTSTHITSLPSLISKVAFGPMNEARKRPTLGCGTPLTFHVKDYNLATYSKTLNGPTNSPAFWSIIDF